MKTEEQIKEKLTEYEDHINNLLAEGISDVNYSVIENYLRDRKSLRWILSDEDYITPDEYEKKVEYELVCFESSKIF